MKVRTRFAPSPTGYLHVGGARTALFNWLFARHLGGQFILRIEDTDLERSTADSVNAIFAGLQWLGLDYDEGPFYQTQRFDRYREVVQQLLDQGNAYRCYCTRERLEALRAAQHAQKIKPRYDRYCFDHPTLHDAHTPYVVRFLNPAVGEVCFDDMIHGVIVIRNEELDDLVIARSDGVPTYNLSVVVDDWDMQITHVIRGDDHINNTPRQINILDALGAKGPVYAHVPMILGSDGKRLSKRHGAVSVLQYQLEGILPEALINYLVRLGWSHGDQEIFSRDELIAIFDTKTISRSPAAFNRDKLLWLNQHYMKTLPAAYVAAALKEQLERSGVLNENGVALEKIVMLQAERTKTLEEMVTGSHYFFTDFKEYDSVGVAKYLRLEVREALRTVLQSLSTVTDWQAPAIHQRIIAVAEQYGLPLGKLAQPLRVAVTGGTVSPPIDTTLEVMGKSLVLSRLEQALLLMLQ